MEVQEILVYIIVALALGGAGRFIYRKIKALRKTKNCSACSSCPLKEGCNKMNNKKNEKKSSCCS